MPHKEKSRILLRTPDSDRLWRDPSSKTISYFCKSRPVLIDKKLIDELVLVSEQNAGENVRICLHDAPDARHHDMVILERKGKYYRPHKHSDKGEAFHIISGELGIFSFNETGSVFDAVILRRGDIYRVEMDQYHAVYPITDYVIYHENKPGPFLGEGDSIFPDWAPDGHEDEEAGAYMNKLIKRLDV